MAKTTSKIIALALTGVCASTSANAAGWQLNDFSVAGLGRAYAGGGVVGDDYSALAYNPAGMTLGGTGVQAGISVIQLHADVTGEYASGPLAGRDSTNVNVTTEVPNFFAQYKVNDRVAVGFGVYVPFGLAIEYPKDWIGTDHGIDSELAVIDYSTAVAVKATDKLSLGLGIFARNANVDLTSSTTLAPGMKFENEFDLDDWGWGLHVGAMYEFTKNTRLGVSYRSRSQHKIKGDFDALKGSNIPSLSGRFDAILPMDAPEQVQLSGYHKLNDKIGLSAGAKWTRWTRFDALTIHTSHPTTQVEVAQRWKNTWNVSVGMDYTYSENWTFRTGIGFDESPVPNSHERTTAIADNDRWEIALGASYKKSAWTFDMGYMFLYLPHYSVHNNRHNLAGQAPQTNGVDLPQIDARYHTTAHVLGLQVQYSFDATP